MDALSLMRVGLLAPVVVVATVLGEWGHDRIKEQAFRIAVFSLLLAVGTALFL